ncbi:MAG: poly-gamma-glutamate hydrolase family protein [Candidatus Melainabacteria bacterium]|nr:MAG: poly-gamma-glutamate hydrolase family protein [Candidatus Melainabacteria bacterium]
MSPTTGKDKYPSMAMMQAEHKEGTSYRIRTIDRKSPITIISPHGGFIEPGTSALGLAIAGTQFNLFDFQGLVTTNPLDLHITSTRFRHRKLSALLAQSQVAISVHCMFDEGDESIYIGGLNRPLKERLARSLEKVGFSVNADPPVYKGINLTNVTNQVPLGGVQLELPAKLLRSMFESPLQFSLDNETITTGLRFKKFKNAVRGVLLPYSAREVA